jgi:HlyD family secretion protein
MINPSRAILVLLVATGFGAAFLAGQNTRSNIFEKTQPQEERTIRQDPISTSVSALGTLEPSGDVHVLAGPMTQLGGAPRIKSINVSEGDRVVRKQVLATFDNSPQVLAEQNRIVANIESKKSEIKILKQQTKRFEQLTATGSFPVAELEEKKVRLAGFQSQLQELMETLKTSNERLFSDTVIRSPINGVVLKINARVGERAKETGVIEIGTTSQMQAVIEVDEADISSIRIGQPVTITSENGAFSTILKGTVSSIGLKATAKQKVGQDPGAAPDSEVRVIDVRVDLDFKSSREARSLTGVKIMAVIKTS